MSTNNKNKSFDRFKRISVAYERLQFDYKVNSPEYWERRKVIDARFEKYVNEENFTLLSKTTILRISALVGKYRAIEPWKYLLRIENLLEAEETRKQEEHDNGI